MRVQNCATLSAKQENDIHFPFNLVLIGKSLVLQVLVMFNRVFQTLLTVNPE